MCLFSIHLWWQRKVFVSYKVSRRLILPVVHLLCSLLNIAQLLLGQSLHHVAFDAAGVPVGLLPSQEGHPTLGLVQLRVPCAVDSLPRSLKHWLLSLLASHPVLACLSLKPSAVLPSAVAEFCVWPPSPRVLKYYIEGAF